MNWARPYAPDDGLTAVMFHPASAISSAANAPHCPGHPYWETRENASSWIFPCGVAPPGGSALVPNPSGGTPYPELSPMNRDDSMVPYWRPSADSSVAA